MGEREHEKGPPVNHRQFENCAVCSRTTLVIGAATETADQEANAERNGGGRIGALLYRCAQEIAGFAGPFSDSFGGISRILLSLAVDVLQRALHLIGLALELRFQVTSYPSQSFFHLAANIFGAAAEAIVSHDLFLLRFALAT